MHNDAFAQHVQEITNLLTLKADGHTQAYDKEFPQTVAVIAAYYCSSEHSEEALQVLRIAKSDLFETPQSDMIKRTQDVLKNLLPKTKFPIPKFLRGLRLYGSPRMRYADQIRDMFSKAPTGEEDHLRNVAADHYASMSNPQSDIDKKMKNIHQLLKSRHIS